MIVKFYMQLDDVKVLRRFGKHPERGKLIPGIFMRRARERRMFEKSSDAYDSIQPIMTLVRSSLNGCWLVTVDPVYRKQAKQWLNACCR